MARIMQPIRDLDVLERFKDELQRWNLRNWMFFLLGINTGLRISDILPIKVSAVRGKYITLVEKKTKKHRRILINPKLRSYLDYYLEKYHWLNDSDYLFPSQRKKNSPITVVQAYRIIREIGDILGLDSIGTHTMRKTFGYHFYQRTKDIATLQIILNHSTQRMTMLYIGLIQDTIDNAMQDFEL